MGTFVRRLLALTLVWLLATAALTYAAAQRIATTHAPATTTTAAPSTPRVLVVPDVRRQAYVFAKGTLGDAGFAWRIAGAVAGYPSNTVASQEPAPGTRVVDTGAPLIVLHLVRTGKQLGVPEQASAVAATAVKLADLASNVVPALHVAPTIPTTKPKAKPKPAVKPKAKPKPAVKPKAKPVVKHVAPTKKLPQRRPPAFVVPGARLEPLDEMPLTQRAKNLLRWVNAHPKPTNPNVRFWLYQHAWIVTGAEMGWWHGAEALQTLVAVDQRVFAIWGIGERSQAVARRALATVEARSA